MHPFRSKTLNSDVGLEAVKAMPPVTVTAAAVASGWDLNHWVAAATLVYIGLQAVYLIWKWRRQAKGAPLGDEA